MMRFASYVLMIYFFRDYFQHLFLYRLLANFIDIYGPAILLRYFRFLILLLAAKCISLLSAASSFRYDIARDN